jgi:hypothetical protein
MRHINVNTVPDRYGMPLPEDLFRRMRGARVLSQAGLPLGVFSDPPGSPQSAPYGISLAWQVLRLPPPAFWACVSDSNLSAADGDGAAGSRAGRQGLCLRG